MLGALLRAGKGLYLKCVLSFPKNEPLTSDIGITDEVRSKAH